MAIEKTDIIKWPTGPATVTALTATGVQAITIENSSTILDGVAIQATGDRTINLTVDSEIQPGAKLQLRTKSNATEDNIFGTGITAVTFAGVAGKTFSISFTYDGSTFTPDGKEVQID